MCTNGSYVLLAVSETCVAFRRLTKQLQRRRLVNFLNIHVLAVPADPQTMISKGINEIHDFLRHSKEFPFRRDGIVAHIFQSQFQSSGFSHQASKIFQIARSRLFCRTVGVGAGIRVKNAYAGAGERTALEGTPHQHFMMLPLFL